MAQNNETAEVKQPVVKKSSFGAAFKEFCRKQMVSLKRKPHNIAFLIVLVAAVFEYIVLGTYSNVIVNSAPNQDWFGLLVFVNTLLSALAVVAFMNTFPKMKKPPKKKKGKDGKEYFKENKTTISFQIGPTKININLVMLAVFTVMVIVMIVCECIYCNLINDYYVASGYGTATLETWTGSTNDYYSFVEAGKMFKSTITYSIVHIVLLAVGCVLTFLVPLYTRLLVKIDTSKKIESAVSNMQEIDLAEDE